MTGSKSRRPVAGASEFKRPSRGLSGGSPLTGGNPASFMLEDTNGNAWYAYVDVGGSLRIAPAASVEPNPQTATPSFDFATSGGAFLATPFQKSISGMSDATATDLMTITVPNVAVAATVLCVVTGSLGAGGAVGAYESGDAILYLFQVQRTAGLNAAAGGYTVGVGNHTTSVGVTGAGTCTLALTFSAVTGGATATQTFTLKATVTKGSGSSTLHVANVLAWLYQTTTGGVSLS